MRHALIVDDSRAIRMIIGRVLRGLGFEIAEAGNGREALVHLGGGASFDLAMVDWNMPEMNGLEFVRAVRAEKAYDKLCLVMVTTEAEASHIATAMEAGANEYIMKPFTREIIEAKLQMLGLA